MSLLTAPQTCQFTSRQLSYLDRLAARTRSCGGVLLSEISSFTKLLSVLEDKLSEVPDYKVAIKQLISLITGALLKQRTSDETNFAKDTIQLLEKVCKNPIFEFFMLISGHDASENRRFRNAAWDNTNDRSLLVSGTA